MTDALEMGSPKKLKFLEKWGATIGLIGVLIGATGGSLALYDRWSEPDLEIIGVAPIAVWAKREDIGVVFTGISLIVGIQNTGNKPAYLIGTDIQGRVNIGFDEYTYIFRQKNDSDTVAKIESEFKSLKPYLLISWVGWISEHKGAPLRVEPDEERFVKLTFAEPILTWGALMMYSGSLSDYIGYEGTGESPKSVNHNPTIQHFFTRVAKSKNNHLQDIRDEVKKGLIKIELRFGTESKSVDVHKIIDFKYITKAAWDTYTARKIYFDLD